MAKEAFDNILHPLQPFKFGLKVFPIKIAIKFNIDLVFMGNLDQSTEVKMQKVEKPGFGEEFYSIKKDIGETYIAGIPVNKLQSKYKLSKNDLEPYTAVNHEMIKDKKIVVDNLGGI